MSRFNTDVKCACGKVHKTSLEAYTVGKGAVNELADYIKKYGAKKAFLFADVNTYPVAGDKICSILSDNGIAYSKYVFNEKHLEPDEKAVGSAVMHYDTSCDIIVCLGSGVLNDISKIVARMTGNPYIIVATAPSMDGYASASSSMSMDGVKVSLNSKCPNVVIGDTDLLKTAPVHMSKSGLGDMLAKYVSICEWRISNIVNGEYYCPEVASYVKECLKKCTDNAAGLLKKDDAAIEAVFEGLIACGMAMEYAGVSRPASGIEHYLSHVWDMRGLYFGTPIDLHGIQCAIGTRYAIMAYEKLKTVKPDLKKGCDYAESFDFAAYADHLREFIGGGAEAMIKLEEKEQKYNVEKHRARLEKIVANWDEILKVMEEELPTFEEFEKIMDTIEAPKEVSDIGIDKAILSDTFKAAKDIRDKYVLPRLMWDMGVIDEICDEIFG